MHKKGDFLRELDGTTLVFLFSLRDLMGVIGVVAAAAV